MRDRSILRRDLQTEHLKTKASKQQLPDWRMNYITSSSKAGNKTWKSDSLNVTLSFHVIYYIPKSTGQAAVLFREMPYLVEIQYLFYQWELLKSILRAQTPLTVRKDGIIFAASTSPSLGSCEEGPLLLTVWGNSLVPNSLTWPHRWAESFNRNIYSKRTMGGCYVDMLLLSHILLFHML